MDEADEEHALNVWAAVAARCSRISFSVMTFPGLPIYRLGGIRLYVRRAFRSSTGYLIPFPHPKIGNTKRSNLYSPRVNNDERVKINGMRSFRAAHRRFKKMADLLDYAGLIRGFSLKLA